METLTFDLSAPRRPFKIMHSVNNGPIHKHTPGHNRSNLESYTALHIPFARNHDAAFFPTYGGEHTVDITAVFPNFDADENDPASYDFACTDEYIRVTELAGTKTFYRLGQKIEHTIKKFGTYPPKDFKKWAVICEHIIRHYNEGWAGGFHYAMPYWEIWNEPDLQPDDSDDKLCWQGTKAQFFDFFATAACHLKACFPHLKIGGPALGYNEEWAEEFLAEMQQRRVPMDFFSWHIYYRNTVEFFAKSERIRTLMDRYGYGEAESILDEWNYVYDWVGDGFQRSVLTIHGIKGAAFTMAVMSVMQRSTTDMLMYYDARPTTFNGLFDYYTHEPLKGYYPFLWYADLYDRCREVPRACEEPLLTLCGVDEQEKITAIVTYFDAEDNGSDREITLDFGRGGRFEVYRLDEEHDGALTEITDFLTFTVKPNTCLRIREI